MRRLETPFLDGLRELKSHALVGDVRGKGLLAGVELVWNKGTREPFPRERKIGAICAAIAEKNGLILRAIGDTLALCPPLVISEAEIGELLKRLRLAAADPSARAWLARIFTAGGYRLEPPRILRVLPGWLLRWQTG